MRIFLGLLVLLTPALLLAQDNANSGATTSQPADSALSKSGMAIFDLGGSESPAKKSATVPTLPIPPLKLPQAIAPQAFAPSVPVTAPVPTQSPTQPSEAKDSSLRDASVTDAERTKTAMPSQIDTELPLNDDPQITRWLVQSAILEKQAADKATNENINERLKLYEQIAVRACAPSFASTLAIPDPLPIDSACLATIIKIKNIQSTNPTAACLESGLQSPNCVLYTAQQRVGSKQMSERDSPLYRLTVGTADATAVKNFQELQTQTSKTLQTTEENITAQAVDGIRRYLSVTCREYQLGTEYLPAESTHEQDPSKRALLEDIDSFSHKSAATPAPRALRLVRLLPEQCATTIAGLKKINLRLAAAICYEQGPVAPQCIQALAFERSHPYQQPRKVTGTPGVAPLGNSQPNRAPANRQSDSLQSF